MPRERLPRAVELLLPPELVHHIYSFLPSVPKKSPEHSPSLAKELRRIQGLHLKGVSSSYLRGLGLFCLD